MKNFNFIIFIFIILGIGLFIISIKFGISTISILNDKDTVLLDYRLNKSLSAILAGVCLPVSGFLLQELFKNPLAGPSVLGISSSAGVGVGLYIFLGWNMFYIEHFNQWGVVIAALSGSFICLLLLFSLSKKMKDKNSFIIIGFLISALGGAVISFLEYISPSDQIKQYLVWSLGSFSGLSVEKLQIFALFTVLGMIFSLISVQMLKGNILGEMYAKSMGVNLHKMNLIILVSTSLLTGITTAFLGPIAFIGIIIPFFSRMIYNPSKLWHQLILNVLLGLCFMLIINFLSDFVLLPINVLASLIGIPILLYIMLKK